jgi:MFS family permease
MSKADASAAWTPRLIAKFLLLCSGVWLYSADTLVTATIAPALVGEIGGVDLINWTISLYEIGAIIAGATVPLLCRRAGLKRVLLGAALLYALGCLIAAFAASMPVVLAGRVLQGLGGGMLLSLDYVAINAWFPQSLWNRLYGIVAAVWAAGSLLGPLIGGLFAATHLWRLAFWVFAAQALLVCLASLPLLSRDAPGKTDATPWPWLTLALLSAGTLLVGAAGIARTLTPAVLECAAGVLLLFFAARADAVAANRMLPKALLKLRAPLGAGLCMVFLLSLCTVGFWTYGPLLLKVLFDVRPLVSGYILASEALAWSAATLTVAAWAETHEGLLIRLGACTVAMGAAGFAVAVPSGSLPGMVLCAMLQGGGFGLCWPSIAHQFVRVRGEEEAAVVSAAPSVVQRIGYAVGTAAAGIAANVCGLSDAMSIGAAKGVAVWVFAAFVPCLPLALWFAWRFTRVAPAAVPLGAL